MKMKAQRKKTKTGNITGTMAVSIFILNNIKLQTRISVLNLFNELILGLGLTKIFWSFDCNSRPNYPKIFRTKLPLES